MSRPYTQAEAKDIISDLDSFNPEIRARGEKKLRDLERHYGFLDLGEMTRIAHSAWTPETTDAVAKAAIGVAVGTGLLMAMGS